MVESINSWHEIKRLEGLATTEYLENVFEANPRLDYSDPDDRETLLEAAASVGPGMSPEEKLRFYRVLHGLYLKDLYPRDCNEFWNFLGKQAGKLMQYGPRARRGRPRKF